MIIGGVGADVIDIARFKRFGKNRNHPFIKKIFTKREINYCFGYTDPAPHLAGTFAAKEATSKTLEASKNFFADIEIRRNKNGTPEVWRKNKKIKSVFISITHTNKIALAIAIKK